MRDIVTYIVSFCLSELLFNMGNWLIVYKYWEVSWTVPKQLKGHQPSKKMKTWLKCGQLLGILILCLSELLYCTVSLSHHGHKHY